MVGQLVGNGWARVLISTVAWVVPTWGTLEISPSFLGMYRKTMAIERDMAKHAARYNVDMQLAHAVVIQESGGNADQVSSAGAEGYFQVMPLVRFVTYRWQVTSRLGSNISPNCSASVVAKTMQLPRTMLVQGTSPKIARYD